MYDVDSIAAMVLIEKMDIERNQETWWRVYNEAVKHLPQVKEGDGIGSIVLPHGMSVEEEWDGGLGVMQVKLNFYINLQEFAGVTITHFDSQKSYIVECEVQYPYQAVSYNWNSETLSDAMNEFFEFAFVPESVLQERCANALGS